MSQPAAPTERPLRKDAERNRQRILEAARIVFAERGLSGSHDDIAREAGVGVGTVYRRFPDKEVLIDALFEEGIQEIAQVARESLAAADPWDGLVGFLTRAQELQSKDRGLKEIVLGSARGAERAIEARSLIAPIVSQIVERAHREGVLREDIDFTDLPVIQLAIGTIAEAARDIAPDTWRRVMTIVFDGLRAGGSPSTPLPAPAITQEQVSEMMRSYSSAKSR